MHKAYEDPNKEETPITRRKALEHTNIRTKRRRRLDAPDLSHEKHIIIYYNRSHINASFKLNKR